jgi:6-phosphogluconate dehydrogenase
MRIKLSDLYWFKGYNVDIELEDFILILQDTLFAGILIAYAQWLSLIQETSKQEDWNINLSEITRIRQWGCIIRAEILEFLTNTFLKNTNFENILELEEIKLSLLKALPNYKKALNMAFSNNIPSPSLSSSLNYFLSMTSKNSSANFIQWLRDYFWAHTYKRIDRDWIFHTDW